MFNYLPIRPSIFITVMSGVHSTEVFEAEELLEEVCSWSESELEALPELYRRKAREFRRLKQQGME